MSTAAWIFVLSPPLVRPGAWCCWPPAGLLPLLVHLHVSGVQKESRLPLTGWTAALEHCDPDTFRAPAPEIVVNRVPIGLCSINGSPGTSPHSRPPGSREGPLPGPEAAVLLYLCSASGFQASMAFMDCARSGIIPSSLACNFICLTYTITPTQTTCTSRFTNSP